MTYKEIARKFKNKWVLLRVTKTNQVGYLAEGDVLLAGNKKMVDSGLVKAGKNVKHLAMLYFGDYRKKGWAAAYYGQT